MSEKKLFYPDLLSNFSQEVFVIFKIFNSIEPDSIRLVGGCVRDILLAKQLKDFDFATKFLPQKVIEILEKNNIKAIPTGVKYGTITAVINHKHFEITTLRKDVENDGRHPKAEFVDDYYFDAARRDFTINALYLSEQGEVYDYFDGIEDLKNQKVKFIGDAFLRINEDFLRIFRFFRFSCFYARELDNKGLEACSQNKSQIKTLSADRIRIEFFKMLECDDENKLSKILIALQKSKISQEILLENINIAALKNLSEISEAMNVKLSAHIKFAMMLFEENLNLEEILQFYNFSNIEKKYFRFLFEKNNSTNCDENSVKNLLVYHDKQWVFDFCLLKSAQNDSCLKQTKKILDFVDNFVLPVFPINGEDLLALGFSGKEIGEILQKAKNIWIEKNFQIDKESLIEVLKD